MPPEVGKADTSSDIVKPMMRMNTLRIGHDHEIEIGPPLFQPAPKFVKHPARIEMIENEIAKFEKPDQLRFSSCVQPSSASRRSSSLSCVSDMGALFRWLRCGFELLLEAWSVELRDGAVVLLHPP